MITELWQGYYLREYRSFLDAGAIGGLEEPAKPQPTGMTKGPLMVGARRVDRERKRMCHLVIPPWADPAQISVSNLGAGSDAIHLRPVVQPGRGNVESIEVKHLLR